MNQKRTVKDKETEEEKLSGVEMRAKSVKRSLLRMRGVLSKSFCYVLDLY